MEILKFQPVHADSDFEVLAALAKDIWEQHFTPIIGSDQVAYMLEKFQSCAALKSQVSEQGYEYFLFMEKGVPVGYTGIHAEQETGKLFLSKLYLKQDSRKKGYSSQAMNFLRGLCKERNLNKIWLTCNKNNTNTLSVYEHMGFVTVDTQKADIGNGFVMDDYILELTLS